MSTEAVKTPRTKHFRVLGFMHMLVTAESREQVEQILGDMDFSVRSPEPEVSLSVGSWQINAIERPD